MKRGILMISIVVLGSGIYLLARPASRPAFLGGPKPLPDPTRSEYKSEVTKNGMRFWPISASVEEGVEYRYNTGHCGLEYMTDFDGSFWIPEREAGRKFYFNEDEGTMTLLSPNRALYRASNGVEADLARHHGPMVIEGACA
jgi:hypothetical protein